MSATDDDRTTPPSPLDALELRLPTSILLPPHFRAQVMAVFAAGCLALLTTLPSGGQPDATTPEPAAVEATIQAPSDAPAPGMPDPG